MDPKVATICAILKKANNEVNIITDQLALYELRAKCFSH